MHRLTRTLLGGALPLALAGCQQVHVTPIAPASARPPVVTDSVRLFYSRDAVPFRYDEIAVLSMDVDWLVRDKEDIYRALRARAGEIGANAVIVAPIEGPTPGEEVAPELVTSGGLRGNALAIFLHLADTVRTPR
jgi:hypothetical protein